MNEKVKSGINKAYWYGQRRTLGSDRMKLKPYPKYKDSGIQWIGKIPEGWEVDKFKHFFNSNMGQTIITLDLNENGRYPVLSATEKDNYFGRIDNPQFILNEGDLVIPARGNSIGFVTLVKEKCVSTQTTIYAKKIKKEINSKFVYYFLKYHKDNLFPFTATAIPQITVSEVKENPLIVPTKQDQTAIANFLDKKTANIGALIEKDKKLIELLKEKRTALINHVVTKGLDPNVKLKDSGIEGIGEIPEGWEVHKLKYRTIINKKKLEDDINPNYVINYVDISNVDSSGNILDIEEQIFEDAPSRARRIPRSGDTIISTVRTYLKAIAYLENIPGNLIVSTGFAVLEPIKSINSKYLFYSTSSEVFIQNVIAYSKGVAYPAINPPELGQIPIIMPSLPEQTTIANFLDKATSKIDKTIQKIEQKINLLEEYKKSLINHVVTGKVDVREAVV